MLLPIRQSFLSKVIAIRAPLRGKCSQRDKCSPFVGSARMLCSNISTATCLTVTMEDVQQKVANILFSMSERKTTLVLHVYPQDSFTQLLNDVSGDAEIALVVLLSSCPILEFSSVQQF